MQLGLQCEEEEKERIKCNWGCNVRRKRRSG